MSHDQLERMFENIRDGVDDTDITFAWQGGEPTLMGLDFFRKAIALQEKYRRPGMTFLNTLEHGIGCSCLRSRQ